MSRYLPVSLSVLPLFLSCNTPVRHLKVFNRAKFVLLKKYQLLGRQTKKLFSVNIIESMYLTYLKVSFKNVPELPQDMLPVLTKLSKGLRS